MKQFTNKDRIIGLEMDQCVCTPCNKGEHENCCNPFCNCNKGITPVRKWD